MNIPILTISLCFFISEISAYNYTLTKIREINKNTWVEFQTDAKGNSYALDTYNNKLYTLNSSNEISSSIQLPYKKTYMIVSSPGDIYFISHVRSTSTYEQYKFIIAILRAGSMKIQEIDQQSQYWDFYYPDNNGNLFYNNEEGIYVFRPHYNTSVLIRNLENCLMPTASAKATDITGNSYLAVKLGRNFSIALITKQTLKEGIPEAVIIPYNQSKPGFTEIDHITVDDEGNLWVTHLSDSNKYLVSKYEDGNFKTLLTYDQNNTRMLRAMPSKGKIYLTAYDLFSGKVESLHCITSNGEAVEITEFKKFSANAYQMFGVSDSEGQVYFFNVDSSTPGAAVTIRKNETKPILITFPISERIFKAKVDLEDNLWISGVSGIYHLKKGETVPQVLPRVQNCYLLNDNLIEMKIYIFCPNGYYVLE